VAGTLDTFTCQICYMEMPVESITYLDCGHYYCKGCARGYYRFLIEESGRA
jgi:hypothetical protein